jgi:futalosine hydrolase
MPKLLIVVSTTFEIEEFLSESCIQSNNNLFAVADNSNIEILITGIGIANMGLQLSRYLSSNMTEKAINLGFCGSFYDQHKLGTLLDVNADSFAELGVESDDGLIMGFEEIIDNTSLLKNLNKDVEPYAVADLQIPEYQHVKGITVQTCTNSEKRALFMKSTFHSEVESMEGAAFFLTCNAYEIPSKQIRSISNIIPGREPHKWNVKTAKASLNRLCNLLLQSV